MDRNIQQRMVIGGFVLVVGVLALIDNLNLFDDYSILRFWPTIFILIGALVLLQRRTPSGQLTGGVFVLAGILMVLRDLGLLHLHFSQLWPLGLIGVGLYVIFRDRVHGELLNDFRNDGAQDASSSRLFAFWSGNKVQNSSQNYLGGEITSIMGGIDLNLRDAKIETEAILDLFVVMGGVDLKVPDDWQVVSDVVPLLGGIDDKTRPPLVPGKILRLKGMVLMGGVQIRH